MPAKPKLKLMVASTVHHFKDQLRFIRFLRTFWFEKGLY